MSDVSDIADLAERAGDELAALDAKTVMVEFDIESLLTIGGLVHLALKHHAVVGSQSAEVGRVYLEDLIVGLSDLGPAVAEMVALWRT